MGSVEVICPKCGQMLKVCSSCIKRLKKIKCPICGEWIDIKGGTPK